MYLYLKIQKILKNWFSDTDTEAKQEGNALIDLWRLVVFLSEKKKSKSHLVTSGHFGHIGHTGSPHLVLSGHIGHIWSHFPALIINMRNMCSTIQ